MTTDNLINSTFYPRVQVPAGDHGGAAPAAVPHHLAAEAERQEALGRGQLQDGAPHQGGIIIVIIIIIIIIVILQVILHYDRPHWRLAGLSGELVSTGTVCITFDDSAEDTEDAEGGGGAALVAFVGGDPAVRAADLGEAELVAEVVEHLGSTLGSWAHMYTGAGDHGPLHVR